MSGQWPSLIDLLQHRAKGQPEHPIYVFLGDDPVERPSLTLEQLELQAKAIGAWLQRSVAPGDRVILIYPPGLDYIAAFFGCIYAGVIAVPSYPPRRNRNMARVQSIVLDSQPTMALTTQATLASIAPVISQDLVLQRLSWFATDSLTPDLAESWQNPRLNEDSTAFLQYTSGSTSAPKGVVVTHRNILHNQQVIQEAFNQNRGSVIVGWLPFYHDMGLIGNVIQPLFLGGGCILMSPLGFLRRPATWLEAISEYRATTSGGPNFAYDLCVRKIGQKDLGSLNLSSWKVAFSGSEPVRSDTIDRFSEAFGKAGFRRESFYPCYGLAVATLIVSGGRVSSVPQTVAAKSDHLEKHLIRGSEVPGEGSRTIVSCGATASDQEVILVDPKSLSRSAPDQVGEIWVAGSSVAAGYWNSRDETQRVFEARLATGEGPFLRTGDLGFFRNAELF